MSRYDYEAPFWVRPLFKKLDKIIRKVDAMTDNQAHLDADVAAILDAVSAIESEIATLKAQPEAENIDFTGLDAAVARIQGDVPAESAPVDSTPVDTTPVDSTPVDDAPVDTPVEATPVDGAPVDDAPVEDAPAEDAPADGTDVAQVPSGDAPVDTADAVDDGVVTPDEAEAANENTGAANPQ